MILKVSTARNLTVWMADSSDHISGKAGLTLTITLSKDGGAFASISPTVTDLGSGWYNLALTTTHTNTQGSFALHVTGTGADPTDALHEVCPDLPGSATVTGGVNVTQVDGVALGTHGAGYLPADVREWNGSAPNNLQSGRVDSYLGAVAAGVIAAASFASGALDAVWSTAVRTLTAFGFSVTVGTNMDKTGYELTVAERNASADALMSRDSSNWETAALAGTKRNLGTATMSAMHKHADDGLGNIDVYKADDTTVAYSQAIVTNAGLDPIREVDGAV